MSSTTTNSQAPSVYHDRETEHEEDIIDLQEYAKILRKHRWLILLTTATLTGLAAFIVSGMTPIYKATSTLLIETQQTNPMNIDELIGIDTSNREYYLTQYEVLRSKTLAKRVVEEMGLYDHPDFTNDSDDFVFSSNNQSLDNSIDSAEPAVEAQSLRNQLVVNRFIKRTTITPVKNTKLVRISFESNDRIFAARVANKIADTYILNYLDSRMEMGEKATIWLNERLAQLKVKLEDSQNRLLNYKEANGLVNIQGNNNQLSEQEIGIITSKLLDAESKMAYSKIIYDEVNRAGSKGTRALLGLPIVDSNELVRKFKIDEQQAQLNLDELLNRYGQKHPRVIDARSRLNISTANLDSQINNIADTIEKDYRIAQQTVNSLQSTLDEGKKEIQQQDRSHLDLSHLEREVNLNQELYDTFYTRSREVDEAENLGTTNAQISEYAEAPEGPFKPKKTLITLLTLILSAFVSFALAILRESFDKTITSTEDVEEKLGVRMLGILPLVSKKTIKKNGFNALVPGTLEDENWAFEESIRTIRTTICVDDLQNSQKVVMVTSALPAEGKSTFASHLAFSLSNVEKVLLIECDLRRPSLHKAFNFDNDIGLAQLLSGEARFAECIKRSAIGNLDVIPAGAIPARPLDLLTAKIFTQLIEHMKKRYDRIIIDSAPIQAVSDALLLGQFADTVLFTVKANSTPRQIATRGIKRLQAAGINVSGAVVSQVNLKKLASYGGEMDYQGYYDYYGYSSAEAAPVAKIHEQENNKKSQHKAA